MSRGKLYGPDEGEAVAAIAGISHYFRWEDLGLNTKGRRGVPADPLLSNRASYQGMRPVGGRPDQRR